MSSRKNCRVFLKIWLMPAFIIVLIGVLLFYFHTRRDFKRLELVPQNGVLDITQVDFTDTVYSVANCWDFYPHQLLFPSDFSQKNHLVPDKDTNGNDTKFGTYHLVIKGRPGSVYTLCGFTVDYGSKIFVNGETAGGYGVVSDQEDKARAGENLVTFPVWILPDGTAEIVYQYSNFVHHEGGVIHTTFMSTPQNIEEFKRANHLPSLFLGSGLIALSMYFFLVSAIQRRRVYIYLALCCVLIAFKDQIFLSVYFLPPDISWENSYRLYIAVVALIPYAFVMLGKNLFPAGKKQVHGLFMTAEIIILLLISLLNTQKLVSMSISSYVLSVCYGIYLLICQLYKYFKYPQKRQKATVENGILIVGLMILLLTLAADAFFMRTSFVVTRCGFAPSGMLIFALMVAVVAGLKTQREKISLAKSQARSEMLEKTNAMNMDFLHKVAHELKTPLTVISGYAQLTGMQLAGNHLNQDIPENLKTIQNEAQRLSELVTTLMDYSFGKTTDIAFSNIHSAELLSRVKAICTPMCVKNNNTVVLEDEKCPDIWGNAEMLLQILINLVVNANRHTQNGRITISVSDQENDSLAVFRVSDTGSGIRSELIPHIFDKGCSGDGGSGLGLNICKEAVEAHGGTITVEKTENNGTVFRFTVRRKEAEK